mgnify:CR=1 FL=1
MLIFFIATTTFNDETRLKVTLPEASVEAKTSEIDAIELLVNMQGEIVGVNEISMGLAGAIPADLAREVANALIKDGHYDHTPEELAYGAKLAWRNQARCIGRLYWDSLTFDAVRQWRVVHLPITLAFAVLATAHIVAIFLFWGWK